MGYLTRVTDTIDALSRMRNTAARSVSAAIDGEVIHSKLHLDDWLSEWKQRSIETEDQSIRFDNVTIVSPDGFVLVKQLSFVVERGQNLLITGPSGAGKSSIVRAMAGLWLPAHGSIVMPAPNCWRAVTQLSYVVCGALRDQIIYPDAPESMYNTSDSDLMQLVALVDPSGAILRQWSLDDERDWTLALSDNQRQRLAIARMLYHKPQFAVLDQCTTMLSEQLEREIYRVCAALDITVITISSLPRGLPEFHSQHLMLTGEGTANWAIQ